MRKLLVVWLLLISSFSYSQTWQAVGNALQRTPTIKGYNHRFVLGSGKGFFPVYSTAKTDSLIGVLKDSTFNKNKNLFDIVDKAKARLNLGITGLLSLKADDNAVVHKTGNIAETVTGSKIWTDIQTYQNKVFFPNAAMDAGGLSVNYIRRNNNTTQFTIGTPSFPNIVNSLVIQPMPPTSLLADTGKRRFISSNVAGLVVAKDSLVISDNATVMFYGTFSATGDINQIAPSSGKTSAFYDKHTITSATDYASYRTDINSGSGYSFKFLGTAPGLTNGDIEIGTIAKGVILKSPDGTRYRITVANGGTLVVTAL